MKKIALKDLDSLINDIDAIKEGFIITIDDREVAGVTTPENVKLLKELDQKIDEFSEYRPKMEVRVLNDQELNLSYDEYIALREQIIKAFEDVFKPKTEKMN